MEIYVVGKQWMWKVQHLDGQREINELHVPVGRPVQADHGLARTCIHSFYIPAFRVKPDVVPGPLQRRCGSRPTKAGDVPPVLRRVLRHEALGDDRHGHRDGAGATTRRGSAGGGASESPVAAGRAAVPATSPASPATARTRRAAGPVLTDVFGKPVELQDGSTVHRRRRLPPRVDPATRRRRSSPGSSRSCRPSRGWSPRSSCCS